MPPKVIMSVAVIVPVIAPVLKVTTFPWVEATVAPTAIPVPDTDIPGNIKAPLPPKVIEVAVELTTA